MPVMLSGYELGNLVILQRTFLAEFVTEKRVRCNYLMSNQATCPGFSHVFPWFFLPFHGFHLKLRKIVGIVCSTSQTGPTQTGYFGVGADLLRSLHGRGGPHDVDLGRHVAWRESKLWIYGADCQWSGVEHFCAMAGGGFCDGDTRDVDSWQGLTGAPGVFTLSGGKKRPRPSTAEAKVMVLRR